MYVVGTNIDCRVSICNGDGKYVKMANFYICIPFAVRPMGKIFGISIVTQEPFWVAYWGLNSYSSESVLCNSSGDLGSI